MTQRKRVVVGMSGGVDSSAAAALLLEQGYEVIGVTLKLWPQDCVNRAEDKCCGPQAVMDARAVCHRLGIPYYLVDEAEEFQRLVIQYFAEEYKAGRTPNPCVMCNEHLKFGNLLRKARALGAEQVATGHYARVRWDEGTGRHWLLRGRDARKDQSYFLFSLRQEQLAHVLFPLGEQTKDATREVARERQLKTAGKEESMEICFVPDRDYGKFLRVAGLVQPHRGDIVDLQGRKVGEHEGIEFYTIGQRKGLRVSHPTPLYVVDLDAANNRVVVGGAEALERRELVVERCNWIPFAVPPERMEVTAKIRYNHPGAAAVVEPAQDGTARVSFIEPQRAITPGQACVFYQGEVVVGGGWIRR
ncbi:tRNA 2-thiouridine(34) synthase MnmA [Fontisphaera persica]|uniref:tRNA 2-thiouridine(34) synthase MnmA n=1 Tax=Fontisphaera persica TaxID=2974023 RepID=UPI0024BFB45A|nr:tRNA 2-thiouridine(34) synthase MnmA [Fontisphaera persica]WCJ60195.1 tRNA 2-thiouridine(34) synthase MnmA [Fontisphaera persica]